MTSSDHRFLAEKQLRDCGGAGTILLEPEGKNTAPAVLAAAHHVIKHYDDALLLVMPSDHHIPDQAAFSEMVLSGQAAAKAGAIVTFGVTSRSARNWIWLYRAWPPSCRCSLCR